MRCQFCGWDNPQEKERCEKCNKPLNTGHSEYINTDNNSSVINRNYSQTESVNLKATVREISGLPVIPDSSETTCPECGYPLENNQCASCGYNGDQSEVKEASSIAKKTIRPVRKREKIDSFTLTPLSENDGEPEGNTITFNGEQTMLNRENTDPKNPTITSFNQAKVFLENGKWHIEDKSEFKTTFVQSTHSIELHDDDIILLGNQLFRFKSN